MYLNYNITAQINTFSYAPPQQISSSLAEHSITNFISKPSKRNQFNKRRKFEEPQSPAQFVPLELNNEANNSYTSYQGALAAATEFFLNNNNSSGTAEEDYSIDNLVSTFSYFYYYDPSTRKYKKPVSTSAQHIIYIFGNNPYFSSLYKIEKNQVMRRNEKKAINS